MKGLTNFQYLEHVVDIVQCEVATEVRTGLYGDVFNMWLTLL